MTAEITGITERDEEIAEGLRDLHAEIHEGVRILRQLEPVIPLLVEALPDLQGLLKAYRSTNGGAIGMLRAGRHVRNGR